VRANGVSSVAGRTSWSLMLGASIDEERGIALGWRKGYSGYIDWGPVSVHTLVLRVGNRAALVSKIYV
jgi:hypothetical protein